MAQNPLLAWVTDPIGQMQALAAARARELAGPNPSLTPAYAADRWNALNQWGNAAAASMAGPKYDPATGQLTAAGGDYANALAGFVGKIGEAPRPTLKLPVRPPSENVGEVLDAQFPYGRDLGSRTVPIDSLSGGVALDNPAQKARVASLRDQMAGPGGYISRPIVDTEGNVIEGQHRLEALRQLGVQAVPVRVLQDLSLGVDTAGMKAAIKAAQPMHSDQAGQLVSNALEALADEGGNHAELSNYLAPKGYEPGWQAAVDYLAPAAPQQGATQ